MIKATQAVSSVATWLLLASALHAEAATLGSTKPSDLVTLVAVGGTPGSPLRTVRRNRALRGAAAGWIAEPVRDPRQDRADHREERSGRLRHGAVRRLRRADPELPADHEGMELPRAPLSSPRRDPREQMEVPGDPAMKRIQLDSCTEGRRLLAVHPGILAEDADPGRLVDSAAGDAGQVGVLRVLNGTLKPS